MVLVVTLSLLSLNSSRPIAAEDELCTGEFAYPDVGWQRPCIGCGTCYSHPWPQQYFDVPYTISVEPNKSKTVTLDLCDSTIDTTVFIYEAPFSPAAACSNLVYDASQGGFASNDDGCGVSGGGSLLTWTLHGGPSGKDFRVVVSGFDSSVSGPYIMRVTGDVGELHCHPNKDRGDDVRVWPLKTLDDEYVEYVHGALDTLMNTDYITWRMRSAIQVSREVSDQSGTHHDTAKVGWVYYDETSCPPDTVVPDECLFLPRECWGAYCSFVEVSVTTVPDKYAFYKPVSSGFKDGVEDVAAAIYEKGQWPWYRMYISLKESEYWWTAETCFYADCYELGIEGMGFARKFNLPDMDTVGSGVEADYSDVYFPQHGHRENAYSTSLPVSGPCWGCPSFWQPYRYDRKEFSEFARWRRAYVLSGGLSAYGGREWFIGQVPRD